MNSSYQLAKVRLVNWHNFIDETLELSGSLFLIGDNGSGKTTVLDAIHCALTGNLKVELNAAARVGGRRDEGRNLRGVVLRYDVERGYLREQGAIAYAALEFRRMHRGSKDSGREGLFCLGIGLHVAGPDARPEQWGFIVGAPLADIPLVNHERRPLDKAELAAVVPQGAVTDIGRYRTRVGERLFGSRDNLEQVSSFLRAGKAYRELVSKTANFSELFASLLPTPDVDTYQEVRAALSAIERTRTDLRGLEDELSRLRSLLDWRHKVAQETEGIARYQFLAARLAHQTAEQRSQRAVAAELEIAGRLRKAKQQRSDLELCIDAEEAELESLRGSQGAELLQRCQEQVARIRRQREIGSESERRERDIESALVSERRALQESVRALKSAGQAAAPIPTEIQQAVATEVDPAGLAELEMLKVTLTELLEEPEQASFDPTAAERRRREVRAILAGRAAERRREEQRERDSADLAARQAEQYSAEAGALRERGEVAPPLPGLNAALELLRKNGITATPLYRLLEPIERLSRAEAGLLERTLGPRRLGTLITSREQHQQALRLLLDQAPGIPLAEPTQEAADSGLFNGHQRRPSLVDLLKVQGKHPVARAYLRHHAASIRFVKAITENDGPWLSRKGHLHVGRADEQLPSGPAVWLGSSARQQALDLALAELEQESRAATDQARQHQRAATRLTKSAGLLEAAVSRLDSLDLLSLADRAARRDRGASDVKRSELEFEVRRTQSARDRSFLNQLESTLSTLEAAAEEQGLSTLADRIAALDASLRQLRAEQAELAQLTGRLEEQLSAATKELAGSQAAERERRQVLRSARATVLQLIPAEHRGDLEQYVLRIRRGQLVKPENIDQHILDAHRRLERLVTLITEADGARHPLLWQKYAFRYERTSNQLEDSTGRSLDDVTTELQGQVDELTGALSGKNEDLLVRIVMEQLVGALKREVRHLEDTVRGVNMLTADLHFGRNQYRIEARVKPEMQRLKELLQRSGGIQPAARQELKQYFSARLDEFEVIGDDELPPLLDYRRWHDFHLRMSTLDEQGVVLSRERLRQGSGGEQAVPSYLLLLCLTKLLYDGIGSKIRLLLLDEAFYGIDLGRRDELLRFCERAGILLVVATPEMDGVSDALTTSTTVLIEKTPEHDVYLWNLCYQKNEATLFDDGRPDPERLVLGEPPPDAPANSETNEIRETPESPRESSSES